MDAAILDLWNNAKIDQEAVDSPPVRHLLGALRATHVNGGAEFARLRLPEGSARSPFLSRVPWEGFPESFLRSRAVAMALPKVCEKPVPGEFGFEWKSAVTLAGEIAEVLSMGGAYVKHAGGGAGAVAIAEDFRRWLLSDRYDDVVMLRSYKPWSAWFLDVSWDCTWLLVDKGRGEVSMLAVTDTD